jgi:hypothetical protein
MKGSHVITMACMLIIFISSVNVNGNGHSHNHSHKPEKKSNEVTITGEILDLACYLDHGARGEGHAKCARKCIKSGLPVGIKAEDGKTYLLIGEHKIINKTLAPHAAKTITIRGKLVSRDGINLIENVEIIK